MIRTDNAFWWYLVGLAQTDGHLRGARDKKGDLSIELSKKDLDILKKVASQLGCGYSISERTRSTNFSESATSVTLRVFDMQFRNQINDCGVPYGRKSDILSAPSSLPDVFICDYMRGLWDGDGSVGITATGIPFMSFTTSSDKIKEFLVGLISAITGKPGKNPNRNTRDQIYNICVYKEDAVLLAKALYRDGCTALDRKLHEAKRVQNWIRPESMPMREVPQKKWDKEQDEFVLTHSVEESQDHLSRSLSSIHTRLWRLTGANNPVLNVSGLRDRQDV